MALFVVSKVFEKLVNNRIVDHLEKLRSSLSTADLLAVVYDRIAGSFNKSGATRVAALDISKAFDISLLNWIGVLILYLLLKVPQTKLEP